MLDGGGIESMLINAVSSVGIPAAISFYLLVRVQSSLDRMTEAVVKLTAYVEAIVSSR